MSLINACRRVLRRRSGICLPRRFRAILTRGAASVLLAASLPSHGYAADIYVTTFEDDAPDNGTCSLREAVRASSENAVVDACKAGEYGDRILLAAGTYRVDLSSGAGEDEGLTGDLDVFGYDDDVEIIGLGPEFTIIDGDAGTSVDRVLHIGRDRVYATIRGVTIRGGHVSDDFGGNVLHESSQFFRMIDVALVDGIADGTGGGGGFAATGSSTGRATLIRTTVTGNRANRGGGLYGSEAGFDLDDSVVRGNMADDAGGGLALDASAGARVAGSRIVSNDASNRGGGVFATGDEVRVAYSTIAENTAAEGAGLFDESDNGMRVHKSAILDNVASANGGGFYAAADAVMRDTTVAGNSADSGGGVYANSGQVLMDGVTIAGSTGGGVYNEAGAFFEASLLAANTDGNCVGNTPSGFFYNLDDGNTCGFPEDDPNQPNFVDTDPLLGPLADNGGPTLTFALEQGSPAIDVIDPGIKANCVNPMNPAFDQRGFPRGIDRSGGDEPRCDIGAFEVNPPYVVDTVDDGVDASPGDGICATSSGTCTLRAAVQEANAIPGLEEIVVPAGTYTLMIADAEDPNDPAATGDLDVLDPLVVRGAGPAETILDAARVDRLFQLSDAIMSGVSPAARGLWLEDLSLVNGLADYGGAIRAADPVFVTRSALLDNEASNAGGAIYCDDDCSVTIRDSRLSGNVAANGEAGAVFQADDGTAEIDIGRAVVERSELSENRAAGGGGAILAARLALRNSTVSGNTSEGATSDADGGGGVLIDRGSVESSTIVDNRVAVDQGGGGLRALSGAIVANTLLAGNTELNAAPDNCRRTERPEYFTSAGGNLTDTPTDDCGLTEVTDLAETEPSIDPLADNGGIGRTHALLLGSPAIDAGVDERCPETDQRGVARPGDGDGDGTATCDIGAYELAQPEADLTITISDSPDPIDVGNDVTYTVTVTNNGPGPASQVEVSISLPAGLDFVSAHAGGADCAASSGMVNCPLGTLPAGDSLEIRIVATAAQSGALEVEATVTAAEADATMADNTATETTTVDTAAGSGSGGNGNGGGGGSSGGGGAASWAALAMLLRMAFRRHGRGMIRACLRAAVLSPAASASPEPGMQVGG